MKPNSTFFLFSGENSDIDNRTLYKSYGDESETDMALKVVMATPEIGPIIKITPVENAMAFLLALKYKIVDGIDGLIQA